MLAGAAPSRRYRRVVGKLHEADSVFPQRQVDVGGVVHERAVIYLFAPDDAAPQAGVELFQAGREVVANLLVVRAVDYPLRLPARDV